MNQKDRERANKVFHAIGLKYHDQVPIGLLCDICKDHGFRPVQEDGTAWSGFLCGMKGTAAIDLVDEDGSPVNGSLQVGWYRMQSGRYEVTAYIS